MKAAHVITAIRRTVAHWLYVPFAVTAWEPSRITTALLPAPVQQQTGAYTLPNMLDGIAGGRHWDGPAGTWSAVYAKTPPHRRRDTGILVPPVEQRTGSIQRLATRLTPIPEAYNPLQTVMAERGIVPVREVQRDLGFAELATWETPEARQSAAIARLDKARANSGALSWLYADPPVLAPLPEQSLASADRTAVSKTTDKPTNAMVELAKLASQDESDETAEVPAYMRARAIQLQQKLRESE